MTLVALFHQNTAQTLFQFFRIFIFNKILCLFGNELVVIFLSALIFKFMIRFTVEHTHLIFIFIGFSNESKCLGTIRHFLYILIIRTYFLIYFYLQTHMHKSFWQPLCLFVNHLYNHKNAPARRNIIRHPPHELDNSFQDA